MRNQISCNKKATLKSIVSIGGKTMSWALVFSLADLVLKGKCLTGSVWQGLIPLAIFAGLSWWWALSRLPDEK